MKNPHFGYDKRSTGGDFLIDHFAGDVVYSCHKFLDKNRDTLSPGVLNLSTCLASLLVPCGMVPAPGVVSTSRVLAVCPQHVRHMPFLPSASLLYGRVAAVADLVQLMLGSQHQLLAQLAVDIAAAQDKRGSQTVGNRFREQLQDLITRLDQCAPAPLAATAATTTLQHLATVCRNEGASVPWDAQKCMCL